MKKIVLLLAFMMICAITLSAQTPRVHGFFKGTHTNDVYTDRRDLKNIEGEILVRMIFYEHTVGISGYSMVNDSVATIAAGIGFLASKNIRFDLAAGVEIDPENSEKHGIFIGRMWVGDPYNDLWTNIWAGERIRYQVIYAHNFTEWLGLGVAAEDLKGYGLYASISPLKNFSVFSKALYNGKNEGKKLGYNLVIDIGAMVSF